MLENREIIALLDLTSLNDDDTPARIAALCEKARTDNYKVAAVCVYPKFVEQAAKALPEIPVATVINFPAGADDLDTVLQDTENALAAGAAEIDLVLPYRNLDNAPAMVSAVKQLCLRENRLLKVIIESGYFGDIAEVEKAAAIAIDGGADFVKTSTGKIQTGATPEAADAICRVIAEKNAADSAGIKISGGVKTPQDARQYLEIIESHFGRDWITPRRVRIGASSLLDALL